MATHGLFWRVLPCAATMLLGFSAGGACPKLIHFTAESGVYKPGGFFELNIVLDCPGPEPCGPCTLTFRLGSGCGAQIGFIDVEQIQPGFAVDINAFMIVPANAPNGTYAVCLQPMCSDCDWMCQGCQGCDCTKEMLTINSPAVGDANGDGAINVDDLVAVILAWGSCAAPCPPTCAADVNGDCAVDVDDLLAVILNWTG
jgi:hypothetical protein